MAQWKMCNDRKTRKQTVADIIKKIKEKTGENLFFGRMFNCNEIQRQR